MTDHKVKVAAWKTKYPTTKDRVEFYSQRFPNVDRHKIAEVAQQFDKVATTQSPQELEQDQVQLFFERRGETMTAQSIKKLFAVIDEDKDSRVNLLEILCAIFKTDWKHLHAASGDADKVDELTEQKLAALKLEAEKEAAKNETHNLSEGAKKQAEEAEKKKKEADEKKHALESALAQKKKEEDDKKHAEEEKKKQVLLKEVLKEELPCLILQHMVPKIQLRRMLKESKKKHKNERPSKSLRNWPR